MSCEEFILVMGANQSAGPSMDDSSTRVGHSVRLATSPRMAVTPRGSVGANNCRPELSRTGVIKNVVNVKKSSVKMDGVSGVRIGFDAAQPTTFRVYFDACEDLTDKKCPIISSKMDVVESREFPAGLDQSWSFTVPIDKLKNDDDDHVAEGKMIFPVIVETVPKDMGVAVPSQFTYLSWDETDVSLLTVIKQKLRYGERGYELHEIFGIEKNCDKSPMSVKATASDSGTSLAGLDDPNGTDCVICLSDARDTTVLPCRHLCLCSRCAEVLRANSRRCPICRQPVSSMLQIDRDIPVSPVPESPLRSSQLSE